MLIEQDSKVDPSKWRIALHVAELKASIIREILKISSQPGVISFAGGLPNQSLFPMDDLKWAMETAVEKYDSTCVQYALSRGIIPLRELLAERATNDDGVESSVDNILMVSGAQQGIEIVARAFIDPGDYILTEYPTYVGALQAFNYYQAQYCCAEMDHDGILIEKAREQIEKHKPKLIYTVSNFQNPTGISMGVERRHQLVELAQQYNIPIIDDNPYGDIRFRGEQVPSLKSIGGDIVVALQTFSKILAPGLRLGWMNGPASIMHHFEKVKQCSDLHTSTIAQYMIYEYLMAGKMEPQIKRISEFYKNKCDLMLQSLEKEFPAGATWTKPDGGLFLWVELPENMSAKELLNKAIERKVAYVYGEPFFPDGGGDNTLRLNFCTPSDEEIREGIKRLGQLIHEEM